MIYAGTGKWAMLSGRGLFIGTTVDYILGNIHFGTTGLYEDLTSYTSSDTLHHQLLLF